MNYGKKILTLMRNARSNSQQPDAKQKYFYIQHKEDNYQFQIKYKDIEKYGVVLDYLSITNMTPIMDVNELNEALEKQADDIQKKVDCLPESFRLIEMDRQNKRVQLRSYPPRTDDDSKYYYEIVLDEGTKSHFQRYQFSREQKRYGKITSQLTTDAFEDLINQLVKILE